MPQDNTPAAGIPPASRARIDFGCGYYTPLLYLPAVLPVRHLGRVPLVLGNLSSGREVRLDVTSLDWLACLESAARAAIGEGIIEAGMPLAVRS